MDSGGSRRCAREEGAPGCAPSGGGGDKAPWGSWSIIASCVVVKAFP